MRENANHMQITRAGGFKAQTADAVAVRVLRLFLLSQVHFSESPVLSH